MSKATSCNDQLECCNYCFEWRGAKLKGDDVSLGLNAWRNGWFAVFFNLRLNPNIN